MTDTLIAGEQDIAAAADAATAEGEAQAATGGEQQTQDTNAGADTQAATAEADKAGEETKAEEAKATAPETYEDFTMPEGVTLDPTVSNDLKALAKELNLPQDAAQKVADLGAKMAQKWGEDLTARQTEARNAWAEESRADKEIGGDKLNENLAVASKALAEFGTPALKDLLNQSGLGNHPEVIRTFVKIGKAISDDRLVTGRTGGQVNTAKSMYPNSQHN